MTSTIYSRLYQRLDDLIPNLACATEGGTFYAPPRIKGDMAMYCTVAKVAMPVIELELAHDQVVNGEEQPAPWMVFRVDTLNETAELLAVQDQWRYEVVYSDCDLPNPRRAPMNIFAVNWLTIMLNLHSVFQPIEAPITLTA